MDSNRQSGKQQDDGESPEEAMQRLIRDLAKSVKIRTGDPQAAAAPTDVRRHPRDTAVATTSNHHQKQQQQQPGAPTEAPKAAPEASTSAAAGAGASSDEPDAAPAGTEHVLSVWATSATDDVSKGPGDATWGSVPSGGGGGNRQPASVDLAAIRGERICFQVGVRQLPRPSGCNDVRFTVAFGGLRQLSGGGKAGDADAGALRATLRRLQVPDALVPCQWEAELPAETGSASTGLWITVDVPRGLAAGSYSGAITFQASLPCRDGAGAAALAARLWATSEAAGGIASGCSSNAAALRRGLLLVQTELQEVCGDIKGSARIKLAPQVLRVNLKVRPLSIPVTPTLPVLCGVSEEVLEKRWAAERGSPGWKALLSRNVEWLLSYRLSPYFCRWHARGTNMGLVTYTSPWPLGSPEADALFSDPRLSTYLLPMPAGASSDDPGTPSAQRLSELQKAPHWNKALFYLYDEPTVLKHYDQLRFWVKALRSQAPAAKVLTTYYCGPKDGPLPDGSFESFLSVPRHLSDTTNVFCTSEWALGERPSGPQEVVEAMKSAAGESSEWWSYVCMGPGSPHPNWHLDMSGAQHRAVAWRVWAEGAQGLLYWGANCYDTAAGSASDPVKWREGLPPGDGVLMYPGEAYNAGEEPVASVRLERALMGLQDAEYLELHAARHGRRATLSLLERLAYRGPRSFAQHWHQAERLKEELAEELLR